jgi:hypothetical protein
VAVAINEKALRDAFIQGCNTKDASLAAGCSQRTAKRWRVAHLTEIEAAKARASEGTLEALRGMSQTVMGRLQAIIESPTVTPAVTLSAINTWARCFEIFRDQDLEERVKKLERANVPAAE